MSKLRYFPYLTLILVVLASVMTTISQTSSKQRSAKKTAKAAAAKGHSSLSPTAEFASVLASPGSLQFTSATFSSNEQTLQASVTVSRTGGTDGAVSVPLVLTNGTATGGASCAGGVDFINSAQTVSFGAG